MSTQLFTSILQTAALAPIHPQLPLTVIWHGIPAEPIELEPMAEASLRGLVEQSNNGRFIIAENSGHYITFVRPDVVIEAVTNMIDSLRVESSIE